jgi:hypothetical protein
MKAAGVVLQATGRRIQLMVACRPESVNGGKDGAGSTNILLWLQQVLPGVQKIVNQVEGAPVSRERQSGLRERQTLVLESEAEKVSHRFERSGSKR